MDQLYIVSNPVEEGSDHRTVTYLYGRYCYSGAVITEPILGLEYLPGVLQGIQGVQGQIPYLAELRELPLESPQLMSIAHIDRAIRILYNELSDRLEAKLAKLAASGENSWLEDDEASLFFEFEALPGYTCDNADVVFAKKYFGEIMLNVIWYAHTGCFYVTLTPVGDAEQSLVDTRFPTIYGKQRGVQLHSYDEDKGFTGELDASADEGWAGVLGLRFSSEIEGGKVPEEDPKVIKELLIPAGLFSRASVWQSDGEVPDPDAIRERDEASAAFDAGEDDEEDEGEGGSGAADGKAGESKRDEGRRKAAKAAAALASMQSSPAVDVSGGNGYTQVYIVMQPVPDGPRSPMQGLHGHTGVLTPRAALFRFGSWVYGGQVDFPVPTLRLGDVPYVLPALQKQQGKLGFISEATSFPSGHPLCTVISDFMAAVGILRQEMEDAQDEVAALAEHSVNAWIDADWAASFFELSFQTGSISGQPSRNSTPGHGLAGAEVIAAKIYLYEGQGIILHCVWFQGSVYCVLSDSVEDLPLLDVAFPDVTARNRVVQVRSYEERRARKLADQYPGSPLPKALRVWEGRRRGVAGVGFGSGAALAGGDAAGLGEAIRAKARERAEAEARDVAAAVSSPRGARASERVAAAVIGADGKAADAGDDDELYDVKGLQQKLSAPSSSSNTKSSSATISSSSTSATTSTLGTNMPTQLFSSNSRAPHHVAPLSGGGGGRGGDEDDQDADTSSGGGGGGGNRLVYVGGDSKMADSPWDASGKPKAK